MSDKPRFPAYLFHRLKNYPRKYCETCGKPLVPKTWMRDGKMQLQAPSSFSKIRFCSVACRRGSSARQASRVTHADESKTCAFGGCKKLFYRRIVNGVLEPKSAWEKKRYCSPACASRTHAAKLQHEKEPSEPTELKPTRSEPTRSPTVIDQLRAQLPPKQKTSPPPKSVQQTKKADDGLKPKSALKVVQVEPVSAEKLEVQQSARKPYNPKVKSAAPGPKKEPTKSVSEKRKVKPSTPKRHYTFSGMPSKTAVEPLLSNERAERIKTGTWDSTPKGEKIEIDWPLKLALFQAFAEHDFEVFAEFFGEEHPDLVKDFERWQELTPALRERRAVA